MLSGGHGSSNQSICPGLFEGAAQPDGRGHVEAAMGVDQDLDVGAGRFADQGGQLRRLALVLARHGAVEIAVALLARAVVDMQPW